MYCIMLPMINIATLEAILTCINRTHPTLLMVLWWHEHTHTHTHTVMEAWSDLSESQQTSGASRQCGLLCAVCTWSRVVHSRYCGDCCDWRLNECVMGHAGGQWETLTCGPSVIEKQLSFRGWKKQSWVMFQRRWVINFQFCIKPTDALL